jgi:hypothetical protein
MTFSLYWAFDVFTALQRLEAAADDPARIREAVNSIDFTLRRTPADMGESREHRDRRVWYSDVLGVLYEIDYARMRVEVLAVGLANRG